MENIATLIEPPAHLSEPDWISRIIVQPAAGVADVHNFYANPSNFGTDR